MQERERILELVKKGVLTTEEALVLLENIATEKDEKYMNQEASAMNKPNYDEKNKQSYDKVDKQEPTLEDVMSALLEEENLKSVEYDTLTVKIQEIRQDIRDTQERLMILDTMEDLDGLSEDKKAEREQLVVDVSYLIDTEQQFISEKKRLADELKSIKKDQKDIEKDTNTYGFDIPNDWKEQANDTFSQMSNKMGEAGAQLGDFLKKTIDTVTATVNDNVDWKDINIKVPGVATHQFTHEFFYPGNEATLIDVKVANGNVTFKTWNQSDVKVEAKVKFYGKLTNESVFEAFVERSDIEVTSEKISFQVPNKRLSCDLVFYLPTHFYDHVAVKMLNGDIHLSDLTLGDVFLKTTNGDMKIDRTLATMLEIEGVNGDITISESQITDLLSQTVNGDIIIKSDVAHTQLSLINGDIKITAKSDKLKKIKANVVNGDLKISIPSVMGVEAESKTNFGSIKNRLSNIDIIREKKDRMNQVLDFRRENEEMVQLTLSTTTGNIYLKDNE